MRCPGKLHLPGAEPSNCVLDAGHRPPCAFYAPATLAMGVLLTFDPPATAPAGDLTAVSLADLAAEVSRRLR